MFWTLAQAQTQSKYLNNLSQKWSTSPILSFVAAAVCTGLQLLLTVMFDCLTKRDFTESPLSLT